MGLSLVTPPASEPVSLADLKAHLRITSTTEDALLEALGKAAREYVEEATGRQLVTATWAYSLPGFPGCAIDLPRLPVATVASVAYRPPGAGADSTLASDAYVLDGRAGRITVIDRWPNTAARPDAVTITFQAGYGDADAVPSRLVAAIKILAASWYQRDDSNGGPVKRVNIPDVIETEHFTPSRDIPASVSRLIAQAKDWRAA